MEHPARVVLLYPDIREVAKVESDGIIRAYQNEKLVRLQERYDLQSYRGIPDLNRFPGYGAEYATFLEIGKRLGHLVGFEELDYNRTAEALRLPRLSQRRVYEKDLELAFYQGQFGMRRILMPTEGLLNNFFLQETIK